MSDNSEFICDVVRVKSVDKHPNADKLDVVQVEGFYGDIICTKGDWKPGDLAVHVGPDAMVPLDNLVFSFLKARLDVKAGSSHYRLRMAKIRGLVSHGILVPIPQNLNGYYDVGESLAIELDVLKYETPAERRLRQLELENVAIVPETRLRRFTKRLVRWLGLGSETNSKIKREIPDYSLVSLRKVGRYFETGEEVEITEKIHGANIRFGLYRGKPFIGSHHSVKSDHRPWFYRLLGLDKPNKNHYYSNDIWTDWVKKNVDFDDLPDNTIFYGEIYGKGVQDLDYGASVPEVRVFDVWLVDEQRWAGSAEKTILCNKYGLIHVPVLFRGIYGVTRPDGTVVTPEDFADGKSTLAEHIREGIVIKSLDGKKRAKLVSDAYKMRKDG